MKNLKVLIIGLFMLLPINVMAISDYLIPGGQSIGIEINTDGILIVGFYKIDNKLNKGIPELKVGDRIKKVGSKEVNTIEELITAIDSEMEDGKVSLTVLRKNNEFITKLELILSEGNYKTGLYVKDSISGIGTISYIDPETQRYCALGHEIEETNSQMRVEVREGSIFRSVITGIDRSVRGTPGGKNAKFYSNEKYGTIDANLETGIYGNYTDKLNNTEKLEVGNLDEIELGYAKIYTVLDNENIKEYEINITKIDKKSKIKNIYFEVTDKELLEKTGGIVQGMSGSPIIQDDKIIGAVTHVVISAPNTGYGISIIRMLEADE